MSYSISQSLLVGLLAFADCLPAVSGESVLPFVKQWNPTGEAIEISSISIETQSEALRNEQELLESLLESRGISVSEKGLPIQLNIQLVSFPVRESVYRERLESQGYQLILDRESIRIESPTAAGVYYGIRTLEQLLGQEGPVPLGQLRDWPDLPVRMIMVDLARQNENRDYYRRMIEFCGRYKINAMLLHLTDDETACLYHEDYPELMHPQAWKPEAMAELVDFARRHHIELFPEIESFGHSRMFARRADYPDILHQNITGKSTIEWMRHTAPGYSNVLCPASDKTYEYLDKMYERAASVFPTDLLHIGLDEVDMTECNRCKEKFPDASPQEWFLGHLLRCRELAEKHGRAVGLWGDMLLSHPEVADGLPREGVVIYDWQYNKDVTDKSLRFFKSRGFEIMASPSLMCWPHFIQPNIWNHTNVRRLAGFAREQDVLGLNTTIWIPTRYMSDILWSSVAYAAVQSWGGSNWNEETFQTRFMEDFFSPRRGREIGKVWGELSGVLWHLNDFLTANWSDEEGLQKAVALLDEKEDEVKSKRASLSRIMQEWQRLTPDVERNLEAWNTLVRSTALMAYSMDHLLVSREIRQEKGWNRPLLEKLDTDCIEAIGWIEEDWDRNRFADDPNKEGIYLPDQSLLWGYKQMNRFHQELLKQD